MATYYVSEAGDNGAGTSWATAKTTLAAALSVATTAGDVILVDKDHTGDNALGTGITFTFGANISIICVDKDNADAPSTMGTAAWIGSSSASRTIKFDGNYRVYVYGLTFRMAGSATAYFYLNDSDGGDFTYDNCYLWLGSTGGSCYMSIGVATASSAQHTSLVSSTLRFGSTSQKLSVIRGTTIMSNTTISSAGSAPTTLLSPEYSATQLDALDCDFSHLTNSTLIGSTGAGAALWSFVRCKLGSNMTVLASQVFANRASQSARLADCSSGDTHGIFAFYTPQGSVVSDAGIYFTSGSAAQSWKITTNASACSRYTPFIAPWIPVYHSATSAITPYFEILRDGSVTAYQDDEVWAEFSTKVTASTVMGTISSDAMAISGTAADQAAGAGLGSWTGENATAWSGKCGLGSSVTPAESGEILGRLVVGEPGITVYLDPQIRW